MKTFIGLGLPVLRFNFRGTGRSEGAHDAGRGEQDDARAGLDWLAREFGLPMLAAGFSFGSNMALRAGSTDSRVHGLVALGTPVEAAGRNYSYDFLGTSTQPKLFLNGTGRRVCALRHAGADAARCTRAEATDLGPRRQSFFCRQAGRDAERVAHVDADPLRYGRTRNGDRPMIQPANPPCLPPCISKRGAPRNPAQRCDPDL